MANFKLNSQTEINEPYQGTTISEFTYSNFENLSEDELIDNFIHSKSFTEDSRSERIKNYKEGNIAFLRQAFEIDLVKIDDFKQTDKNGLIKFVNNYAEAVDWGESDGDDFIKLKDRFIEFLKTVQSDKFYLINKEWFPQNDKRLREPENWIYSYYFLFIWIDKINKTLTVSEWTYD